MEIGGGWEHVFCSRAVIQHHTVSLKEVNYLFPLYLYPQGMFTGGDRTPNFNPTFLEDFSGRLGLTFAPESRGDLTMTYGPEDVFHYAYAVFHAPGYRSRYSEFLKVDFPRLPLTSSKALFAALVGLGAELAALHLMEAPALETFITRFPVPGSQVVEAVRYDEAAGRVYINADQYFEGVPPQAWGFQVGGYQVLHKWLKDRKGRVLSYQDLHHYQKMVVALAETIRLMEEIDAVILAHGGWPIAPP
jgi:predicted helicase